MAFVFDSFTGGDSILLENHTGETGATWTLHPSFTDTWQIQSNRAGKGTLTGTSAYYASGLPPGLEYSIEADIVDISDVNRACGIAGWIDTAADNMIVVRRQTSTAWQLLKIIAGVATSIDTEPTTFSAGASRHLKLSRTGDSFEWFLDGASLGSFTISDSEFQSAGRVGLRASNAHFALGYHVDNFVANEPTGAPGVGVMGFRISRFRPRIFAPGIAR